MARLNEFKYILSTHWTCLLCHHTPPERSNRYSRFAGRSPGHTQWPEASALSRKRFFAQRCRWETDDHLLVPRGVPATWDALKKRREEEKRKKEDRKVSKKESQRTLNFEDGQNLLRLLSMTIRRKGKMLMCTFHVVLCCFLHFYTGHFQKKANQKGAIKRKKKKKKSLRLYTSVSVRLTYTQSFFFLELLKGTKWKGASEQ